VNAQTKLAPSQTAPLLLKARTLFSRILAHHSSALLLLIVLGVEAALGIFVIRDLITSYTQVERIYAGSVQGLRRIGELQYETQEARRATLYALTTNDGNLQVEYADQSREADQRVSQGISQYLAQAKLPREIELGNRLARDWDTYLRVRDDVLGLILESSPKEAVAVDLTSGVSLFDRVRQDVEQIKRLYDEQASQELVLVTASSQRSVLKLIGGLGFALILGSAAIWAIQKNKMRSEMQLAKLQMDFVASVSHELRTPIAAILCAGENVRDGFARAKADLVEQGSIVVDQATQLAGLVDQVLLFAATSAKPQYHLRPIPVSEILTSALKNTAVLVQKSGFTIEQQIQQELPPVVGDLPAISQSLQNLISNAVKYGAERRTITLAARVDDCSDGVREVQISVQDSGPGISSSDLSRIFEPFFRSPRVAAAQIHGTGLGLSIAKSMIEAVGGRLSVVSEVGVGSTFTLYLPVAENNSEMGAVRSAAGPGEFAT
jgi:signal transduction histidine kinase